LTVWHWLLLSGAGLVAGANNSVSSGGSFFTYPAMLFVGLEPLTASVTTLAALTPGNLAAIPEFWPEVTNQRARYGPLMAAVIPGSIVGIVLLFWTGADLFDQMVPWLILTATFLFAVSPWIRTWAETSAPSLTQGAMGTAITVALAVYLTYFGSGVGNLFLALLIIRGFGDFLSANAAKNVVMTTGTVLALVVYGVAGLVAWWHLLPVFVGSAIGGRVGSRWARSIPLRWLRGFIIGFGCLVAAWQFLT